MDNGLAERLKKVLEIAIDSNGEKSTENILTEADKEKLRRVKVEQWPVIVSELCSTIQTMKFNVGWTTYRTQIIAGINKVLKCAA